MALLRREQVAPPRLEEEVVNVPELGGDVIVRAMTLVERLDLARNTATNVERLPMMLASVVLDADRNPLFNMEQWNAFGGKHADALFNLWDVARRLSGLEADDVEKNSTAPTSK